MRLVDSYNNTTYDTSSQGGVFVQFAILPTTATSGYVNLPGYTTSMEITLLPIQSGNHTYNLETVGGIKRISWTRKSINIYTLIGNVSVDVSTVLMVFAK